MPTRAHPSTARHTAFSAIRAGAVAALLAGIALIATVGAPASAAPATAAPATASTSATTTAGTISATGSGDYLVPASSGPFDSGDTGLARAAVVSPDSKTLYVSSTDGVVRAISVATGDETDIDLGGFQPRAIVISPDGKYLYVAGYGAGQVEEIQVSSGTVVADYTTLHSVPISLALSPDGSDLFIAEQGEGGGVEEVAAPTLAPVGFVAGFADVPRAIVVSPDGTELWVVGGLAGNAGWAQPVTISNLTLGNGVALAVNSAPAGVAISPDGSTLYVANGGTDTIQAVSTAADVVEATEGLNGLSPIDVAVSPNGESVWFTTIGDGLFGVNTSNFSRSPVSYPGNVLSGYGLAVSPDGNRVYAGGANTAAIAVMNVVKLSVSGPAQISAGTASVTFHLSVDDGNTPVGDHRADLTGVSILDSAGDGQASALGLLDSSTGMATVELSTSGLATGTYTVEADTTNFALLATVSADAGPFVVVPDAASAGGGAGGALATTGTDAGVPLGVGAILVVLGAGALPLALTLRRRARRNGALPNPTEGGHPIRPLARNTASAHAFDRNRVDGV